MARHNASALDQDPWEVAGEEGLEVVEPGDHELQLDCDSEEALSESENLISLFRHNEEPVEVVRVTRSRSPGHYHITLRLTRPVSPLERITYQACLGSDVWREAYSLLRLVKNLPIPPTVFFEQPGTRPTVALPSQRAIRVREEEQEDAV